MPVQGPVFLLSWMIESTPFQTGNGPGVTENLDLIGDERENRGTLLRRRWLEFDQLLIPLGRPLGLARGFVQLHEALKGFLQTRFAFGGNLVLPLLHPFVAGEQQRLRFGVFLLPQKSTAQQAPGVKRSPVVRNIPFALGQTPAGQPFSFGKPSLVQPGTRQFGQQTLVAIGRIVLIEPQP